MDESYLGDSYDLVKRFLCQTLYPIAPLYAHPQFVPSAIREAYVAVTTIPILGVPPQSSFGILLDPDKGVCLGRASSKRAPLSLVVELHHKFCPKYIVCFDQSFNRNLDLKEQMRAKGRLSTGAGPAGTLLRVTCPIPFHGTRLRRS